MFWQQGVFNFITVRIEYCQILVSDFGRKVHKTHLFLFIFYDGKQVLQSSRNDSTIFIVTNVHIFMRPY